MGDIFPVYYVMKYNLMDCNFIAESPCEVIVMKIMDVSDAVPVIHLIKIKGFV